MREWERLKSLSNIEPEGLISASTNFSEGRMEESGELDHYIGAATAKDCPDDFIMLEVPDRPGLYSKPSVHSRMSFRKYGGKFTRNGFRPQIMSRWKVLKFF